MALLKKRKTPKYSSVSVDGSTPVSVTVANEKELSNKKLTRAIKNSPKSKKSESASASSDESEQKSNENRIFDSRLKESVEVIKSFLNIPKDVEFTEEMMVAKFLQLIKDYTSLYEKHHSLLKRLSDSANRSHYQTEAGPSWN